MTPTTDHPTAPPTEQPAKAQAQNHYTRDTLLQMLMVLLLLGGMAIWQRDMVYQIYLGNQINALGWVVNGSILALFSCGLGLLIRRFFRYRGEESNITQFLQNIEDNADPLRDVDPQCMVANRYQTLLLLNQQCATVNQSTLAATLLACESSRNSFLKFVHNVLILIGVFGTIVSLSLSLLGAADIIQGAARVDAGGGLGTMIFGMSTALSTTMTAILAYLVFGYFYIKLTDTQTYLISRIEEVTATRLMPHLQMNRDTTAQDYASSIRRAGELIKRFDQSQKRYESAVQAMIDASQSLSEELAMNRKRGEPISKKELGAMLTRIGDLQQLASSENRELLSEVIGLLQEGFRLQK